MSKVASPRSRTKKTVRISPRRERKSIVVEDKDVPFMVGNYSQAQLNDAVQKLMKNLPIDKVSPPLGSMKEVEEKWESWMTTPHTTLIVGTVGGLNAEEDRYYITRTGENEWYVINKSLDMYMMCQNMECVTGQFKGSPKGRSAAKIVTIGLYILSEDSESGMIEEEKKVYHQDYVKD